MRPRPALTVEVNRVVTAERVAESAADRLEFRYGHPFLLSSVSPSDLKPTSTETLGKL